MCKKIFSSIKNKIIAISFLISLALIFFLVITALNNKRVEKEVAKLENEVRDNNNYFELLVRINTVKYNLSQLLLYTNQFQYLNNTGREKMEKFEVDTIVLMSSIGFMKTTFKDSDNKFIVQNKFYEKISDVEKQCDTLISLMRIKINSGFDYGADVKEAGSISDKIALELNELSTMLHLVVINSNVELSIAQKKLSSQVEASFYISLIVSTLVFICLVVLFLSFSNRLLISINHAVDFAKAIGSGNFLVKLHVKENDEFKILYEELNVMSKQLEKFTSSLSEKNIELNLEIDERAKTEKELKQLQALLLNIINSMPSVLIGIDKNCHITHWNTAAEKKTGVLSDLAFAKNIFELQSYLIKYKETINDVISFNITKQIFKESFNEEKRYYNLSFFPFDNNESRGVVIRIDDVTEIELKEEQVMQSQKMDTIGSLAGGIAHDFNNILGGIIGIISLIKMNIESDNIKKDELAGDIKIIEEASNRAKNLVNNLLMISKKKEPIFKFVNLNDVLRNVMNICINTFDKSIEIKHLQSQGNPIIAGDQDQVEQLLLNLCVNALHAMTIMKKESEKQGGLLTVSVENVVVDKYFSISHPEAIYKNYWILRVCDTGVGMDNTTLTKIFDPFFTTKEKGTGTGLGLSMVYNIVKDHKGFINVYSELNTGTIVSVYFPEKEHKEESAKNKLSDEQILKGSGFILVIDDESIIRYTTKKMLEEYGYTVFLAENGEEGMLIYKEHKDIINLVLLDMAMPKISGKETFEGLIKINPKVKVLISSGFKMDNRVQETLSMGALGFIHKPYTIKELIAEVNKNILSK